jgi:hypothetical protein
MADALLAPSEIAEQRIRAALGRDVGSWPFERSRMQLMLGSRLRRQKQAQQARELLRAARDGFDSLGAQLWAERAREELRAAGVASHLYGIFPKLGITSRVRLTAMSLDLPA